MAPYDNLPHFRRWLENKIGHTSKSRNDMAILGDFLRYHLTESVQKVATTFQLKYRDRQFNVTVYIRPSDGEAVLNDEMQVELTDDALWSLITQCAFNEGSILNERKRQRKDEPNPKQNRAAGT